jgi:hypothetical protein
MGSEGRKERLRSEAKDAGFFEALRAVDEQAGSLAMPVPGERWTPRSSRSSGKAAASRGKAPRWMLFLLGASLFANVGLGALFLLQQKEDAAEPAPPQAVEVPQEQPKKAEVVPMFLPKSVVWNERQIKNLPEDERRTIESQLAAMPTGQYFISGFFNMVFVPGVSKFELAEDGTVTVQMFLHNGFLRKFTPKRIALCAYYYEGVVFNGTIEGPLDEWLPGEVRMVEMTFTPDEVKDPKLVKNLIQYKSEQNKLSIQARFAVDEPHVMNPLVTEEVWMFFNTHTAVTKDVQ